jgi:hypothetical protein
MIVSGWAKNPLAWIIAEVRNQQVNHKVYSIKLVIELSEIQPGLERLRRSGTRANPAHNIEQVISGAVLCLPEIHLLGGDELLFRRDLPGDYWCN